MNWNVEILARIQFVFTIALATYFGLDLNTWWFLVLGDLSKDLEYAGNWLDFLNPYAFLIAFTTLSLFMMHGAMFLLLKTEDRVFARLTIMAKNLVIFFIIMFAMTTVTTLIFIPQMAEKFRLHPTLFALPSLAILSVANIPRLITKRRYRIAFIFSGLSRDSGYSILPMKPGFEFGNHRGTSQLRQYAVLTVPAHPAWVPG